MSDKHALYSVIIPVGSRVDDLTVLIDEYAEALKSAAVRFEVIVVLDGQKEKLIDSLCELASTCEWLHILQFSREFGESAALMAGFGEARGEVLITLPAYWQVEPSEVAAMVQEHDENDDLLIAVRWPRVGSFFERIRRRIFHGMLKLITGLDYRDLGCGVRLLRREIAREVPLYGDQYRFLPVLAVRRGFRVREVELAQSKKDVFEGRYRLREYLHGILNVMTVFFLVRFTKKPLRFFGSVGFIAAAFGSLFVFVLVLQRLFYGVPLADRPALLLGSLLIVLGVQLFALGLLGELIIFSHAGQSKEYAIRTIVGGRESTEQTDGRNSEAKVDIGTS